MDEEVALTEEQELAAMDAGFGGTDIVEPVAEKPAEPEPEQPAVTEEQPAAEPEPEQPKPLTRDDINAAVEQALQVERASWQKLQDKLFGTVGNLQQKIDAARTATVGLSPKAREKVTREFPELAAMLFEEEEAEPGAAVAPATPQIDVDTIVSSRLEEERKALQLELMDAIHPDWRTATASPEFAAWTQTLPATKVAALNATWRASELGGFVSEFKQWKAAEQQKAAQQQSGKERLEAAILPKGKPAQVTDIDDEAAALEAGFYGSSKRR